MSASDRAVELVVGSGIFDVEWYAAQAGATFAELRDAIRHYLAEGRRQGLSPHPLFVPSRFRPHRWARDSTDPLVAYLEGSPDDWGVATSLLFDPADIRGRAGGRSPLQAFLEDAPADTPLPLAPDAAWLREGVTLADVRAALRAEVQGERRRHGRAETVPELVTVVAVDCGTTDDVISVVAGVSRAARGDDNSPVQASEIVAVVPPEARPAIVGLALSRLAACDVRAVTARKDGGIAEAIDEAVNMAEGQYLLLMSARHVFHVGSLAAWPSLLAASRAAVLHPVVLTANLLLRDVGVVYPPQGKDPVPFLRGVHPDSVPWQDDRFSVPGAPAPWIARMSSVRAMRDSDAPQGLWADIDLSQRLAAHEGRPVVVTRELAVRRTGDTAFDVVAEPASDLAAFRSAWNRVPEGSEALFDAFAVAPVFVGTAAITVPARRSSWVRALWLRAARHVSLEVEEAPPALHWAIKTAVPPDLTVASQWGDTHFAHSLADALRGLGQHAVVDYRPNDSRETSYRDDVVVVLRGRRVARLPVNVTSVAWVISHPEDVTAPELATYDLRYAASYLWAEDVSRGWDIAVRPLLQCTDSSRFYIDDEQVEEVVGKAVLVGNSRGRPRPVVTHMLQSGAPLVVYGSRWEKFVPPEVVAGRYVPNEILRRYYRSADWALNDHWPDMRDLGFVSNRVFDILAAGGRLLTDDVRGLDEVVGPVTLARGVPRFTGPEDLRAVLAEGSDAWYGESTLRALSEHVRSKHDFAARAAVLLDDVLAHRSSTGRGATTVG